MANKQIHELDDTADPLDGTELLPVSQATITGKSTLAALRARFFEASTVTSGSTQTPDGAGVDKTFVYHSAATLATLTITLPVADYDGQVLTFTFDHTITSLTVGGTGGDTVNGAPASAGAAAPISFMYSQDNTAWFRV